MKNKLQSVAMQDHSSKNISMYSTFMDNNLRNSYLLRIILLPIKISKWYDTQHYMLKSMHMWCFKMQLQISKVDHFNRPSCTHNQSAIPNLETRGIPILFACMHGTCTCYPYLSLKYKDTSLFGGGCDIVPVAM